MTHTPPEHDALFTTQTLQPLIQEERLQRIESVLEERTYHISVVLEALYDEGNMAAVMRTCDALGIQRVNLVSLGNFKLERKITQGAHKWLDVHQYTDPKACVDALHQEGYQVVATHLDASRPIEEFDFSKKTALIFGNEARGVSDPIVELADARMYIPMSGFVQSFNVSVAAAISLYHATQASRKILGKDALLSEEERHVLRARWYRRTVRESDLILRHASSLPDAS